MPPWQSAPRRRENGFFVGRCPPQNDSAGKCKTSCNDDPGMTCKHPSRRSRGQLPPAAPKQGQARKLSPKRNISFPEGAPSTRIPFRLPLYHHMGQAHRRSCLLSWQWAERYPGLYPPARAGNPGCQSQIQNKRMATLLPLRNVVAHHERARAIHESPLRDDVIARSVATWQSVIPTRERVPCEAQNDNEGCSTAGQFSLICTPL